MNSFDLLSQEYPIRSSNPYTLKKPQQSLFEFSDITLGDPDSIYGNLIKSGFMWVEEIPSKGFEFFYNLSYYNYDQRHNGINNGMGVRKRFDNLTLGLNTYYDSQYNSIQIEQFSFGIELSYLHNMFYSNFYMPFRNRIFRGERSVFDDYIGDFIVNSEQNWLVASGFDFGFSKTLQINPSLQVKPFLGMYSLSYPNIPRRNGFQGGIEFRFFDRLTIEPLMTRDHLSKTHFNIRLGFSIPLWGCKKQTTCLPTRRWYVPIRNFCDYETNY